MIETSPGSFQAWLALPGKLALDFARRVRKGAKADVSASGATRIAGSLNFKDKYAPDYPRVMIHAAQPRRMTDAGELEGLGLVAPPEELPPLPRLASPRMPAGRATPTHWPAHPRTAKAPAPTDPRRISWGFSVADTAAQLMHESTRAQEARHGKPYADHTAKNAAEAVKARQQPRQTSDRTRTPLSRSIGNGFSGPESRAPRLDCLTCMNACNTAIKQEGLRNCMAACKRGNS
jgi:hypothetical protein